MKFFAAAVASFLLFMAGPVQEAAAQSAVYVYKNPRTGEGDFMLVYGMPAESDAEFLAQEKLIELGYAEELVRKQASSPSKGYGIVVRSTYTNRFGKETAVFGAAVGCKSPDQARQDALTNLKRYNPEWVEGTAVLDVQTFVDR